MTCRISCVAIALALVLLASPLWAGPESDFGSGSFQSISEALESFADPFTAGENGEGGPAAVTAAGRLVLPWGRNGDGHRVVLSLKNDSKMGPRAFKAFFLSPGGEVVAVSEKVLLPARGSVSFPVDEIIAEGMWLRGSIEILYKGPGPGRVFGNATQMDLLPMPRSETQRLVQAEFHISKNQPGGDGR